MQVGKSSKIRRAIFRYAYARKHFFMDRGFRSDQASATLLPVPCPTQDAASYLEMRLEPAAWCPAHIFKLLHAGTRLACTLPVLSFACLSTKP